MKLLILEDNELLAELTRELLRSLDRPAQCFREITIAGDLQTALAELPAHDIVLSDGHFPLAPESRFIVDEWDVVRQEAARLGIRFVLYTGCPLALDRAQEAGIPALAKPSPIQEVYAALTRGLTTRTPAVRGSHPVVAHTPVIEIRPRPAVAQTSGVEVCGPKSKMISDDEFRTAGLKDAGPRYPVSAEGRGGSVKPLGTAATAAQSKIDDPLPRPTAQVSGSVQ